MKGGAVNEERSPLKEAIDLRKADHEADEAIVVDRWGAAKG